MVPGGYRGYPSYPPSKKSFGLTTHLPKASHSLTLWIKIIYFQFVFRRKKFQSFLFLVSVRSCVDADRLHFLFSLSGKYLSDRKTGSYFICHGNTSHSAKMQGKVEGGFIFVVQISVSVN
jgi:hypothetical protein